MVRILRDIKERIKVGINDIFNCRYHINNFYLEAIEYNRAISRFASAVAAIILILFASLETVLLLEQIHLPIIVIMLAVLGNGTGV
jgi:hypothetical protein